MKEALIPGPRFCAQPFEHVAHDRHGFGLREASHAGEEGAEVLALELVHDDEGATFVEP